MLNELEDILHGIELVKECSHRTLDLVMSFGERMSCHIVASYLKQNGIDARFIDTRELIITDDKHGKATVLIDRTNKNLRERIVPGKEIPVMTGFIASTTEGVTTTLGRNGSDYTAAIIAAAVKADMIEIWTDVEGVMSADPAYVTDAFVLPQITYLEAMELSYFGAKVIHPYSLLPAVENNIPIKIKSTFNPEEMGTLITNHAEKSSWLVRAITSIDRVALVNIEGSGMIGVPGMASRIFSVLAQAEVNIMMISQASSEHSICIVLREEEAEKAILSLKGDLVFELQAKRIQNFELMRDLAIVAVIGEKMRGTPGISGKLFSALGDAKINIMAIAQGSSERNISVVISKKDEKKALNAIHLSFLGRD